MEGSQVGNVNYIFVSDDTLLELNKTHLNHDYLTDILSFQLEDDPAEGDIFISIDRVKENAESYTVTFDNELCRVIAHGMLHFLGYKDKTEEEQKVMRKKEDLYLGMI